MTLDLILLIAGLVCFALAAINVKAGSLNLIAAGLFLVFLRGLLP